jgi:hypothetical protein
MYNLPKIHGLRLPCILTLLLRELKKGETFASLLNIHGRDIRVVPTHLVFHYDCKISLRSLLINTIIRNPEFFLLFFFICQ